MDRSWRSEGWGAFAVWGFVGALFSFSVLAAASIGLFVLPVAVIALIGTAVFVRVWPEITGVVEGVAALSLYLGLADLSTSAHVSWPWLLGGAALASAGLIAYFLARPRS